MKEENQITFAQGIKCRSFEWKPQTDITAYEVALCAPLFNAHMGRYFEAQYESLPDNAKRHFVEL